MNSIRLLCAVVASALSLDALAQGTITAAKPAVEAALQLNYRSAFDGYRAYQEPVPRPWRETNDEAGSLGGHAGQLKPRFMPPGAASATGELAPRSPAPPPKAAGHGHEGHAK